MGFSFSPCSQVEHAPLVSHLSKCMFRFVLASTVASRGVHQPSAIAQPLDKHLYTAHNTTFSLRSLNSEAEAYKNSHHHRSALKLCQNLLKILFLWFIQLSVNETFKTHSNALLSAIRFSSSSFLGSLLRCTASSWHLASRPTVFLPVSLLCKFVSLAFPIPQKPETRPVPRRRPCSGLWHFQFWSLRFPLILHYDCLLVTS